MTEVNGVSRGQFIRNAAKGSVVLVGAGGVLATMDGVAFAKTTKSDITVLQTGYIAETLAVTIYGAILKTYFSKLKLDPGNRNYFEAAYKDEKAHQQAWKKALGKDVPTGFTLTVPGKYVASKYCAGRHRRASSRRRSSPPTWARSRSSTPRT